MRESAATRPPDRIRDPGTRSPVHGAGRRRTWRLRRAGLLGAAVGFLLIASTGPVAAVVPGLIFPVQNAYDRGTDVEAIQHLLRSRLSTDPTAILPPADRAFLASTTAAVNHFQAARSMPITGVVDSTTWAALVLTLRPGYTGEAVRAVQVELVDKRRAAIAVDGVFGPTTTAAVVAFQKHVGLTANGVVDPATWKALTGHFELPHFGARQLCDYSVGNGPANWGTAEAIATLEAAGRAMVAKGYGRIAVGDVSLEHGGNIPLHETHEHGLDVDVRPLRKANDQCAWGTRWSSSTYDRAATRAMIQAFRSLAPGHIKLIYFNDPILIGEGLTRWYAGHDDHIHVRFCERIHPLAIYDC